MYRSKKQAVLLFSTHLLSTDRSKEEKKRWKKAAKNINGQVASRHGQDTTLKNVRQPRTQNALTPASSM